MGLHGGISPSLIQWGIASAAMRNEAESGDLHVVREFSGGVLVGVVDGLGHGPDAAVAAKAAVAILESYASDSVISLASRCHEGLTKTRGVVMSLASFNASDGTMTWLGVGNVEGVLHRADPTASPPRELLLSRAGVVGYLLPNLYASVIPIHGGDTLIFTTDGIRSGFSQPLAIGFGPQLLAEQILRQGASGTDDALVVVARFEGAAE